MAKTKNRQQRSNEIAGFLFLLPWLLGLLFMYAYPLLSSIVYSFTDFNGFEIDRFVGFHNFEILFQDRDETFWKSVWNTLVYTAMAIPVGLVGGLSLALVMNMKVRLKGLFRIIAFLPTLVPAVATGIVWQWLLNSQFGLINQMITSLGGPVVYWMDDPMMTKPSLVLIGLWGLGGGLLIYLAGLRDVPETYYEAATLDGAGKWKKFWHVTFPLISPILFYQLVTGIIGALQQFTLPYLIGGGGGGPLNSMLFYNMKLYNFAFNEFAVGQANAMAWLMFIVIMIITVILYKSSNRWVHYMGD